MTHTPGPWRAMTARVETVPTRKGGESDIICEFRNSPFALDVIRSNAALIAAAPAMYEALKRFEQAIKSDCYDQDLLVDIYHDVREALRLANGGKP